MLPVLATLKARHTWLVLMLGSILFAGCGTAENETATTQDAFSFTLRTADQTGLHFANKLEPTAAFNMFTYMYFYNGAGVGVADFNQDSLPDIFFAGNQVPNKLFLNKGQLQFEDITQAAGIRHDSAWSTGVSIVDINNDNLPDIYVCRASQYEGLTGKNQLLVCQGIQNGIPIFKDEAAAYGIDFQGLSTQAIFFDYDLDGDLDLFLMNHAPSHVGRFAERSRYLNTYDSLSGDRMYRRDGNWYTDVTRTCGIQSSAISYGLGLAVGDINLDGWPDIYVGNDFHENDYCYINNRNGTFTDQVELRTRHTSQFTMGVDIADATNDGFPEIVSMDMLPADHYMQKRSLGEDNYDIFDMKLRYGYHPYFTRNNLQLNRRTQFFSETGYYSGIAATDWSWSCLFTDFDNDGWKDLFISNGIPKRLNDIDWVNFISQEQMQQKLNTTGLTKEDFKVIEQFPEIKLSNYFYRNKGQASFEQRNAAVKNNLPTFSNGAAYADFDNDGDLDLVVNNIEDEAMLYENTLAAAHRNASVSIRFSGPPQNTQATGTRLLLFAGQEIRSYEHYPVHGFLSSMQVPMHVGMANTRVDSALVVWPDNSYQRIRLQAGTTLHLAWQKGLPPFDPGLIARFYPQPAFAVEDLAAQTGLRYEHTENLYREFNREPLMPHLTSTEGPALAVADVNADGLDDVFFGSARDFKSALFMQQPHGRFMQVVQPSIDADSVFEDVDAQFADVNNDGAPDLLVASGGNEFYGESPYCQPRLYLNDGKGQFRRQPDAFAGIYCVAGTIAAADFDKDGFTDVFVGARAEPFAYGITPRSYLLKNDGRGRFTDVTGQAAPQLQQPGLVKQARWHDLDGDSDADLLLSLYWQAPVAFMYDKGKLSRQELVSGNGFWNFMLPLDANGDGHIDLLAGNLGQNSRFRPSPKEPVTMYVGDFDNNGRKEQILTYYLGGKEGIFAGKEELQRQLPGLKKQYLYAEAFAKARLDEIFSPAQLSAAEKRTLTQPANGFLINNGKGAFHFRSLPWLAQLSSYFDAVPVHANADSLQDLLLVGNFNDNNIQLGRNDADYGMLLLNRGQGNFECASLHPYVLIGESRRVRAITVGGRKAFVIARNNAPAVLLAFKPQP